MMLGSSYKSTSLLPSWSDLSDSHVFGTSDLVGEIKKNLEFLNPDLLFDPDSVQLNQIAPVDFLVSQPVYTSLGFNDADLSVIDFDEAGSGVQFICETPVRCGSPQQYEFDDDSALSSPSEYYCPDLLSWEDDVFSAAISMPVALCDSEDSQSRSVAASSSSSSSSRVELVASAHAEQPEPDCESEADQTATPLVRLRSKSEQTSARPNRKRMTSSSSIVSPIIPCSPLSTSSKRRRRTPSARSRPSSPSSSVVQNLNLQYVDTIVQIDSLSDSDDIDDNEILVVSQPIEAFRSPASSSPFVCGQVVKLAQAASSAEDEDEDVDIL